MIIGRQFISPSGIRVSVGRNAKENDRLWLGSNRNDLWFHIEGYSGSHVVLHSASIDIISSNDIEFASNLAVKYSGNNKKGSEKMRGLEGAGIKVTSCKVRDLYKCKNDPDGMVRI